MAIAMDHVSVADLIAALTLVAWFVLAVAAAVEVEVVVAECHLLVARAMTGRKDPRVEITAQQTVVVAEDINGVRTNDLHFVGALRGRPATTF